MVIDYGARKVLKRLFESTLVAAEDKGYEKLFSYVRG